MTTPEQTTRQIIEWSAARERVAALVAGLSPDEVGRAVPACPDWSVRDLLSHMVGLAADVLAGDEPDDHNPAWTQAQVDARRDRTATELLEEWAAAAPGLEAWMRERGARPLGDVIVHEQDIRGAVGRPGGTDSDGFAIIRDRMAGRFGQAVADAGLAPIALVGDSWTWRSDADVDPAQAGVRLRASDTDPRPGCDGPAYGRTSSPPGPRPVTSRPTWTPSPPSGRCRSVRCRSRSVPTQ